MSHPEGSAMPTPGETALSKIETHEQVCAERYKSIEWKLGILFHVLGWGGGTLICGMGFVIWHLVSKTP